MLSPRQCAIGRVLQGTGMFDERSSISRNQEGLANFSLEHNRPIIINFNDNGLKNETFSITILQELACFFFFQSSIYLSFFEF